MSYRHFDIGHHGQGLLFGSNLKPCSLETVKMFYEDAHATGFKLI